MIRYFLGGLSRRIQGEEIDVSGDILQSAFYEPSKHGLTHLDMSRVNLFLDSGAFQRFKDSQQVSHGYVLDLQLHRERQLNTVACALASNDRLIDEKDVAGVKVKQRWSVDDGWQAVRVTIDGAHYLASQRGNLGDRTLVLGCQGVNASQYATCVREVLAAATAKDWIGLGGWCILGKQQRWMPTFRETILQVIPLVAASPVRHVHIYGVLFEPALGNLLWLCDHYELTCSTDSKKPLSDCRWKTPEQRIQAGARQHYYRDNVQFWRDHLEQFRQTPFYRSPYCGSTTIHQAKQGNQQLNLGLG